jgi:hypothetical protein
MLTAGVTSTLIAVPSVNSTATPDRLRLLGLPGEARADLNSIKKGNCEAVPLIGQFWTVVTSAQLPVTLMIALVAGEGFEPSTFGL